MSYIRCRKVLSRSFISTVPVIRAPLWRPVREFQTRRPQQPSQTLPQRSTPSPPPSYERPESILDEKQQTKYSDEHKRQYEGGPEEPDFTKVKVRFLVPTIWALTVSAGVYISLAYFTAKKQLEEASNQKSFGNRVRKPLSPSYINNGPPTPTEVATRAWRETDPMSKLSWSLIGGIGAVHLFGLVAQSAWTHLWHIPATNRNYTLFTSTYVHRNPIHLGMTAYVMYNFLPAAGNSHLFRRDTNHMLSFFVTTGIMSALAQHIATPYMAYMGASGALYAVIGACCMQYPTAGLGIIFIPYYIEAQYFLPMIMLFDFVGMVRGFSFLKVAHAVCSKYSRSCYSTNIDRHISVEVAWVLLTLISTATTLYGDLLWISGNDA